MWKLLYLPIFILTTDDTIGCVMNDNWCQKNLIVYAGPHTYQTLWCANISCGTPCAPCPPWGCLGHMQWTSSHMWDNWNFPVFLLRDGSLNLIYMAAWWSLQYCVTPYSQWWSCSPWYDDLCCLHGHSLGKEAQRCSLSSSPKGLTDSPIYSSSHSNLSHL